MKTQETKATAAVRIGSTTTPSNADRVEEAISIVWGVQDELYALEYLVSLFRNENNFDLMKAPEGYEKMGGAWRYISLTIGHIQATLTQEANKLEKAFDILNEIR